MEQEKIVSKDVGKFGGKEEGKSVDKEFYKVNEKDFERIRDLIEFKDEDKEQKMKKEKGKTSIVKSALIKSLMKQQSTSKVIPKSTNYVSIFCINYAILIYIIVFI